MSEPLAINTCGACRHIRRDPSRLDVGLCRALPPSATWAHDRAGNPHVTGHAFPVVQAAQEACGVHFMPKVKLHAV